MNFPGIQYPTADITWLSPWDECLQNPISIGQFINNETPSNPANVMYQELDIPLSMLRRNLWQYLPYLHSNGSPMKYEDVILKTIVLVSCRKIVEGEELRSTYMQRINNHDR
ncbi:hypothetical protein BKA69DRAFT_1087878 [Paraphysoderma sedebokerense]|nr:hypothetical protein BKA69DRAFT_1095339 [Paraphysoderma sedebokerense]KAI9137891.1 hypothetical protein BKA69DRAFT_1095202 [Paraphysoderma sedebokerense]KAI9137899.1 hypothetical protein BKA69DRAFT_1095267 [Paraphysoderma sedebokerense]KAI9139019.1 hypothetical protein BKA69DRAFT_1087878 [Paraphysoderma sedebokerense]